MALHSSCPRNDNSRGEEAASTCRAEITQCQISSSVLLKSIPALSKPLARAVLLKFGPMYWAFPLPHTGGCPSSKGTCQHCLLGNSTLCTQATTNNHCVLLAGTTSLTPCLRRDSPHQPLVAENKTSSIYGQPYTIASKVHSEFEKCT